MTFLDCSLSPSPFLTPAPTQFVTLSLHDALPILLRVGDDDHLVARLDEPCCRAVEDDVTGAARDRIGLEPRAVVDVEQDRKSTRLNFSHGSISYAVFCLKTKKRRQPDIRGTSALRGTYSGPARSG